MSYDSTKLLLFDLHTQSWAEVLTGTIGWLNWSKDGKYLIVLNQNGTGTPGSVVKIRLSDRKIERVVDLTNFATTGHYGVALAVAPDDSPLLLRDAGTYDVYSLDWQAP